LRCSWLALVRSFPVSFEPYGLCLFDNTVIVQWRPALKKAGIAEYVRPFHDARHSSITHQAAAGSSPVAIMASAGHSSMATTKRYLHLAGVVFREEADALDRRLLGGESVETSGRK
jgi:integrase